MPAPRSMTSIASTSARIAPATTTSACGADASCAFVISDRSAWLTARTGNRIVTVPASPSCRTTGGSPRAPVSASSISVDTVTDDRLSPAAPAPPAI